MHVHARLSCLSLFWTQADVALNAVRVPRPAGSSFTYRRRAPRRPASARVVGTRRKKCMGMGMGMGMGYWLLGQCTPTVQAADDSGVDDSGR